MAFLAKYRFRKWHVVPALAIIVTAYLYISRTPFGTYTVVPDTSHAGSAAKSYSVPLDPESPWPKFRGNELQNARSRVIPVTDPVLKPWMFKTGKGIFSSAVVDAEGTVYIGSADHYFYAVRETGVLKWNRKTGEVIDSSALLDDRGRVYVGSGDAHVYCMDRNTGKILWKFKADPVGVVEKKYSIKSYNVDWFEGNIAMLEDGTIVAPNDNFLVYAIDRDTGARKAEYLGNELMWSLPAVNPKTGRIFFGSQYMALKNVFCIDVKTGRQKWTNGGLGSNAASPLLTSTAKKGAVVLGGYDGYVRAYAQDSGKLLWKRGLRDHIYASAAQLSDGTIIQPSADGTVYALNPKDGSVKWAFDTMEPIRSSPAVDGKNRVYVGSGEGRLFCINPDGTLRWAYLCIDEDRNDLNGSPGLGRKGVYIGGENGGVFFVPYDYPMTPAGRKDPRCTLGPGEVLPARGDFMVYTGAFGKLMVDPPSVIDANQPLAFTLFVRRGGDTVKSMIDPESLVVTVTGSPKMRVKVSANRQFFIMTPMETWTGPDGGVITVSIRGDYRVDPWRIGLKFFGGKKGGSFARTCTFKVPPRLAGKMPYRVPVKPGDPSAVFAFYRLAAPNPTMLPSWNQIGFDSLHYLGGAVEGRGNKILVWVVPGKLHRGGTVVNPDLEARFPLTLEYDGGLLTFYNYDGFKINFIGSWDMPFGFYRVSTAANPATGVVLRPPVVNVIALCDELEYYGRFLKLMGMSEFDTGHMPVFGGMNLRLHGRGHAEPPAGAGKAAFTINETSASVKLRGCTLKKKDHVFSLLLVDAATGRAFPLYYTKHTEVKTGPDGTVTGISVRYKKGQVKGDVRLYYLVDTCAVARETLKI